MKNKEEVKVALESGIYTFTMVRQLDICHVWSFQPDVCEEGRR